MTPHMPPRSRSSVSVVGAVTIVVALGGCKFDNRPLLARREPPPAAPALGPLDPTYGQAAPAAYPPPVQAYAYPQRAYAISRVVHQRPPSYAFAYGDEQPWAWEVADQGLMFAEPVDDDWRYYYYEPGEAYPYFVQDAQYGYAYGEGGVLLALFDAAGALIAADRYHDYAPRASRYWTRAYDLNRTYWRSPRHHVEETVWREWSPRLVSNHDRWFRAVSAQPAWSEAMRHDNGRHLGWYKDRARPVAVPERGRERERQIAVAAPPQPRREVRAEHAPPQRAHAWKEARQDWRPEPQRGPGPQPRRQDRPSGDHGQKGWGGSHGGADQGGGHDKGGQDHGGRGKGGPAFAQAADAHGRPAASRGPAHGAGQPKEAHPGGGPHGGAPHGGGGHDKGGGHGKGGGGNQKGGGGHKGGHEHGR